MPDLLPTVQSLLLRELEALKREIAAFPDNSGPWMPRAGVTNTSGTLALHCAGNIQHFLGARLGNTGYLRQRELEFSRRDIPRDDLVAELDRAIGAVHSLDGKLLADLPPVFPDSFGGNRCEPTSCWSTSPCTSPITSARWITTVGSRPETRQPSMPWRRRNCLVHHKSVRVATVRSLYGTGRQKPEPCGRNERSHRVAGG